MHSFTVKTRHNSYPLQSTTHFNNSLSKFHFNNIFPYPRSPTSPQLRAFIHRNLVRTSCDSYRSCESRHTYPKILMAAAYITIVRVLYPFSICFTFHTFLSTLCTNKQFVYALLRASRNVLVQSNNNILVILYRGGHFLLGCDTKHHSYTSAMVLQSNAKLRLLN